MPAENHRTARIAAALQEALLDLGIPNREVARGAGVAPATVARIKAGRLVRPDLLFRVASVVLVYDVHTEPEPEPEDETAVVRRPVWAVPPNGLPELVARPRRERPPLSLARTRAHA